MVAGAVLLFASAVILGIGAGILYLARIVIGKVRPPR